MSITVLIVDDEENSRKNIGDHLTEKGYQVVGAATLAETRILLKDGGIDVILLDVRLPDGFGPNLLYETAYLPFRPPIILITGYGDIEMAVEAMHNGAHDFIAKPIEFDRLEQSIQRACEIVSVRRELANLSQIQIDSSNFVVGKNKNNMDVLNQANIAARASVSVLLTGETGSGKEVIAQFIHGIGPRKDEKFVAINCAAIQSTVLESELFGYEQGAFTGAVGRKKGLMEVADGGILFLDEISSMPLDIQAKLLRAIEEKAFRRVGGTNLIKVDVQIIAASNRDLKAMIEEEEFRQDLFFRLKVVDLHAPALRERKEDIPELVGHFIKQNNSKLGMNVIDISQAAMDALTRHAWPGNIRELSNAIERAILFCDGATIELSHLPSDISKT
ncbi:MAG: sigma-54 dependent transcriptional regulator [Anaerolineaceae bacterium]|nr:sigma-54 dependent transcriptional regulator [Anaerolineaceae bacterium]